MCVCVCVAEAAHADTALDSPAATSTAPNATNAVFKLVSLMREWNRSAHKSQSKLMKIAEQLIEADPRVPPAIPPRYITDPAAYHKKKGIDRLSTQKVITKG